MTIALICSTVFGVASKQAYGNLDEPLEGFKDIETAAFPA